MEKEDLIKKLEKISLPDIEVSFHKEGLREKLLETYSPTKRRGEIFIAFRRFAFASLGLIILGAISFYLVLPEYTLAKAGKIVLADPQVKSFITEGGVIKEIRVLEGKGYALIGPTRESEFLEIERDKLAGVLVEVDIKREKVARIEKIVPPLLNEIEKERIREISRENIEKAGTIPQEAKLSEIKSLPSELGLIQKGEIIEVAPKEKKASLIYELDKKKWEEKVDLLEEKVEVVDFLGGNGATSSEEEIYNGEVNQGPEGAKETKGCCPSSSDNAPSPNSATF